MNNLKKQFFSKKNTFNTLFLPGLPGEYKDRPLTEDLKNYGSNMYSLVYPGTYNSKDVFSPASVADSIKTAIKELNKSKLPLLVITYSFSTLFLLENLKTVKNPLGLILFSPIMDLKESINSDLVAEIIELNKQEGFNIDIDAFKAYIKQSSKSYKKKYLATLKSAAAVKTPKIFVMGEMDPVIKFKLIKDTLEDYRMKNGYNQFTVLTIPDEEHRLDGLYSTGVVSRFISGIAFSHYISKRFPNASTYIWGASLNYKYSNETTDTDIIIIDKDFSMDDYLYLNNEVNTFKEKFDKDIDIIVNTFEEVKTKERIRSNRGPSFVHELEYYYLPLKQGKPFKKVKVNSNDLKKDALYANNLNLYKSKKALLNYIPGTPSSNWIIKNFIIACFYDQYLKGNIYPNQNIIEDYYKEKSKKVFDILSKIKSLKNDKYKGVTLKFLKEIVETHEKLIK